VWKDILSGVSDNAGLVFTVTILVLCIGTVLGVAAYDRRASIKAYWAHRQAIRIQRGLVMGRKKNSERQAYIKGRWCDGITDFGEKEFLEVRAALAGDHTRGHEEPAHQAGRGGRD